MRRLKNKQMLGNLEQPDYEAWLAFESTNLEAEAPDMIKDVAELEPQYDVNARYLTVPDDLSIIAESGILLTHFRPYMGRLRGTHSKLHLNAQTALYHLDHDDGDPSDHTYPDETHASSRGSMHHRIWYYRGSQNEVG